MRYFHVFAATLGLMSAVVAASETPFRLEVISHSRSIPVGIDPEIWFELVNTSGQEQLVSFGENPKVVALVSDANGNDFTNDAGCGVTANRTGRIGVLPADWRRRGGIRLCLRKPGTYFVTLVPKGFRISEKNLIAADVHPEDIDLWKGGLDQPRVVVEVIEPDGVDGEAFVFFDEDPAGRMPVPGSIEARRRRPGELLRRFPTSTYAAYEVWQNYGRASFRGNTDGFISRMTEDIRRQSNSVPCDQEVCGPNGWMSLSGRDYVEWRVRWFEIVLENHPQIWFADEVRLKLALDHYLLGDHDAAIAGLEGLAEHGGALAAKKCRELLAAMKAKGMLEGGSPTEEGAEAANTE